MQIVLMNNINQQDRPMSAGAAAAAVAAAQAAANLNAIAAGTTTDNDHSTTSSKLPSFASLQGPGTSTASSDVEPSAKAITFTPALNKPTESVLGTATAPNDKSNADANNSNSNNNNNGKATPYKYRDYSTVNNLEGIEGYNSDESDPPPPSNRSIVAAAAAGAVGLPNPAVSAIHDAHTMRLQKFPAKLESILSRPEWSDIVTWMPHGRSWKILKPHDFETLIMPLYFDHCNYHSFNRLVNAWSFRRMSSGPDRGSYYHELFLRGRPTLHRMMRRLPKSQKKAPMSKQDEPDFYAMSQMAELDPTAASQGTSPAALAAAAAMPMAMSAQHAATQAMAAAHTGGINMNNMNMGHNINTLGNVNALAAAGLGGNMAAATNDVGQLSLMEMFGNLQQQQQLQQINNQIGMMKDAVGGNGHQHPSATMVDSLAANNVNDMDTNATIQVAMARIAQQQLAERAQMSQLLGTMGNNASMGTTSMPSMFQQQQQQQLQQPQSLMSNDFMQSQAQMQHQQDQDQQVQQDTTSSLEANFRATQVEHDRLQQQIAALQAQQQQIANEQLQLQQFQQQATVAQHQLQFQQHHNHQLTEASLQQAQQESKMGSPILGTHHTVSGTDGADAGSPVANSPVAKSG